MEGQRTPKLKDQSAAYKLFHWPFMWRYAENEDYDENDLEYFGRTSTGDTKLDYALATTNSERYITTAKAAQLAASGVAMSIEDPADSVVIYQLICQHLRDWHRQLKENGIFGRRSHPPIEGLKEFNNLAKILVPVARRHGLVDEQETALARNARRRSFSLGTVEQIDIKAVTHNDNVYNEIAALTRALRHERRG